MRWSFWMGVCFISICSRQMTPPGSECQTQEPACETSPAVRACVDAAREELPTATDLCERAWRDTHSEAAAVAGANYALHADHYEALREWADRPQPTTQG